MSLTLVLSLFVASATCTGDEAEVPTRVEGFAPADAEWLRAELGTWLAARGHSRCDGRGGLTLTRGELEVLVTFELGGRRQERTLSRGDDTELFRYQVAAAAEELVRSTWEGPPPATFGLFARGEVAPLGAGPVLLGGALGGELFVLPSLAVELSAGAGALTATPLPSGASVSGSLVRGGVAVTWLPVKVGVLRAGVRAGADGGALSLQVASVSATTPWVAVRGGLTVGLEFRHFTVGVLGEVGTALVGGAVLAEGVAVLRVRGVFGAVGLQAGVRW